MADLQLDGVWMSYEESGPILKGLSIDVADGEFYAMVGPSGSGKTSILKVLGGFVEPDAGRVVLDGNDVTRVPPERRDLGIVFQSYALFPHLTVTENVGFGLRMRGVKGSERGRRVAAMLELVGLPGFEGRYPDELSGGQQQRVALARALVTEPKALLLDEPLSALDRKIRQEMQVELRRIQRETGITAIIVTHDQEEALSLGDRLMVLDDGQVRQEGAPWEVYSRPRDRFVASFLGSANLFGARVDAVEPPAVTLDGEEVEVRGLALPAGASAGSRVALCVRPERWEVQHDAPAGVGDGLVLEGAVAGVQQSGQVADCRVRTATRTIALTVLSPGVERLAEGARVRLRAAPADIHVLDDVDAERGEETAVTASAPPAAPGRES